MKMKTKGVVDWSGTEAWSIVGGLLARAITKKEERNKTRRITDFILLFFSAFKKNKMKKKDWLKYLNKI